MAIAIAEVLIAVILFSALSDYFSTVGRIFVILLSISTGLMIDVRLLEKLKNKFFLTTVLCTATVCAFCFIGNPTLIYPINKRILLSEFALFVLGVVWCVPIVLQAFKFIEIFSEQMVPLNKRFNMYGIIFFVLIIAGGGVYEVAFYPGLSSADTWFMMGVALKTYAPSAWHSPLLSFFYRILLQLWNNPAVIAISQLLLFALANSRMLLLFHRIGMRISICIALAVFIGVSPNFGTLMITIWKDIPYTVVVLLLGVLFAEYIIFDGKKTFGPLKYFEMILYSALCICIKSNGIVFVVIIFATLFLVSYRNWKVLVSLFLCAVLTLAIYGPLYSYWKVETNAPGGKYIALGQDIRAVIASDQYLPDAAMDVGLQQGGKEEFDPYCAGGASNTLFSGYNYAPSMGYFLKAYIQAFLSHPIIVIRSILCRTDCMWNIRAGVGGEKSVLNAGHLGETLSELFDIQPTDNMLTENISAIVNTSTTTGFGTVVFWRVGLYFVLAVLMVGFLTTRKQWKCMLLIVPALGQALGLVLSCGWMSYRYYVGYLELLILFLGCAIVLVKRNASGELEKTI